MRSVSRKVASQRLEGLEWRVLVVVKVCAIVVVAVVVEFLVHLLIPSPLLLAVEIQRFTDEDPAFFERVSGHNGAEAFVQGFRRLRGISYEMNRVLHRLADERQAPIGIDGLFCAVYCKLGVVG